MKTTHESFSVPKDIDPDGFFCDCFGIIKEEGMKVEKIRVKVYKPQLKYLTTLPLHSSQKIISSQEDFSILEWRLKPSFDFRQQLLSLGENVEVLEPAWFREEFGKVVGEMKEYYR